MPLQGNRRKKFCNPACRLSYNQKLKMLIDDQAKDILTVLKKNSSILKRLLDPAKKNVTMNKSRLQETGFRFNYITHTLNTTTGATGYYCHGYAYFILDDDHYLIMRGKDVSEYFHTADKSK